MNRRFFFCLALSLLILAAWISVPAQAARRGPAEITLLSFGSMRGELVTCGCRSMPKGGLARRAALVDSLRTAGTPFLHLELGDFSQIDGQDPAFETGFIWSMLERTGVDAVAFGPRDFAMWETIEPLLAKTSMRAIVSNVSATRDGRAVPLGRKSEVLEVNGVRVGLFSLVGKAEVTRARLPRGMALEGRDPLETAQELVPELRAQADIVVLMSQMDPSDTNRLLETVDGIDIALYGQSPVWEREARRVGRTIVNETGDRGQFSGELTLVVDPRGEITSFVSRNRALGKLVAEDAEVAGLISGVEARIKEMEAEARRKVMAAAASPPGQTPEQSQPVDSGQMTEPHGPTEPIRTTE